MNKEMIREIINMTIENEGVIILNKKREIRIIIIRLKKVKQEKEIIENIKQEIELIEGKIVKIKIIENKGIRKEKILKKIEGIIENEKKAGIIIKRYLKRIKRKNRMIKGIEIKIKGRMKTGRGITRSTKEKIRIGKIKKSTYDNKKEKGKRTGITKVGKYTIRIIITYKRSRRK